MSNQPAIPKVEHEAELAALAAWTDFSKTAKTWSASGTPGVSSEAVKARSAMVDVHADPTASDDDIEKAEAAYHAACLGQAHTLASRRKAALARITQMMRTVRAETDAAASESAGRVQAVDDATRSHVRVIHNAILAAHVSSARIAAGRQTGS